MKKVFATLLLYFLIPLSAFTQSGYEYGLSLVSYPAGITEFSGLVLCDGKQIPFDDQSLTLSFELFTREECVFGTVARAVSDKGDKMDLIYTTTGTVADQTEVAYMSGNLLEGVPTNVAMNQWISVSITYDRKSSEATISYSGSSLKIGDPLLKNAKSLAFSFGSTPGGPFQSNDIASVDVRNVSIIRGDKVLYRWSLMEHEGNVSYDSISSGAAVAVNPRWIIDRYVYWDSLGTVHGEHWLSYAFDGRDSFYFASDASAIDKMSAMDGSVERIDTHGDLSFNAPELLVWEKGKDRLLFYNFDINAYSLFDPESSKWGECEVSDKEHLYFNKTTCWNPADSRLYSFGGYGHHLYNNNLVVVDPSSPSSRRDIVLEDVLPRYNSSSCIVGDCMYIFGGRGSESAKQELSPRTVYDLICVDLKSFHVTELWETGYQELGFEADFLPGGNMVYDQDSDAFYVLANVDGVSLLKVSRSSAEVSVMSKVSEKLPHAQYVYRTLFLDDASEHLYAVSEGSQVDGSSDVYVWSLDWPPYPVSLVTPAAAEEKEDRGGALWWLLAAVAAAVVATVWAYRKLNRQGAVEEPEAEETYPATGFTPKYYLKDKSCINLLGHFSVQDRTGQDITSQFSPISKNLLILLVLLSEKYPGGIPGNLINTMIWSYKDESSANNTRNVFMYKLRSLLEKVGDINIYSQNKLWKMELGDDVFCDYLEARRIFSDPIGGESVDRLLELLMRGMLLPNIELDWVDTYKGEFSNMVIDFMEKQLNNNELNENVRLSIADTVFKYDYLNEEALKAKCRILYEQGKAGLAKNTYDFFCRQYKDDLDITYPVPLKEIVDSI